MGNKEIFDSIANQYNTPERIDVAKIATDAIKRYIANGKAKTAIDFGCGTGLIGLGLINQFKSIVFVDSAPNMIQLVEQSLQVEQITNASAICIDLEAEERLNITTDYIIATQVLLHIKDVEKILEKLYSLLNKNGHLIIVDYNQNDDVASELIHNGFNQEELSAILKNIGFSKITSETFYHGKNIFMKKDASLFIMNAEI